MSKTNSIVRSDRY